MTPCSIGLVSSKMSSMLLNRGMPTMLKNDLWISNQRVQSAANSEERSKGQQPRPTMQQTPKRSCHAPMSDCTGIPLPASQCYYGRQECLYLVYRVCARWEAKVTPKCFYIPQLARYCHVHKDWYSKAHIWQQYRDKVNATGPDLSPGL